MRDRADVRAGRASDQDSELVAVEAFDIQGHPKARRCYAWSYEEGGETQYVTVLEIPPVDSAETAVKVAIAASARK